MKTKYPTAKQIRSARCRAGFSQKQAAAYLRVSEKTYQRWEEGVTVRIRPQFLEDLLELPAAPKNAPRLRGC